MQTNLSLPVETDRRQRYLQEFLVNNGYQVILAKTSPELRLPSAHSEEHTDKFLVLLPIPVSASLLKQVSENLTTRHIVLGGNLPKDFTRFCHEHHIPCIDYFESSSIAIENAIATAEGAICEAIQASEYNLHQSQVLVIGFGKCGEILADKLVGLKCQVTISTRDETARARAKAYGYRLLTDPCYSGFRILFNTAPSLVIDKTVINQLSPDTVIIDIASNPGGTDFAYCLQKGITAKLCPGIPGKYSPKTSAQILFDHISKKLSDIVAT